jgi:hypothetical protein
MIIIVILSQFNIQPSTKTQPTTNPTAAPAATPNLTSAIPDNSQRISVNLTALNTAHLPIQWDPIYFIHITNNGDSSLTVISIICTAIDDQTNFTYWSGNQEIVPNATRDFSANSTYYAGWPMNDICVYYQLSGQLSVYTLAHPPLPTYSPARTP